MKQIALTPFERIRSNFQQKKAVTTSKNISKIAALDGVRAVAALLVVILHISDIAGIPWSSNSNPIATAFAFFGRNGVVLFFVLSGFLLFMPYARALLFQEAWPSARKFYLRRIFRIWPGYYLCLFIIVIFFTRTYLTPEYRLRFVLFLTFLMDSSPQTWQHLNGPFWTLATEWQFYMLLPLLALAFAWLVRRFASTPGQRLKATVLCCCGLIVLALTIRAFGLYVKNNPGWNPPVPRQLLNGFLFITFGVQGKYLEVFALGMMASALYIFAQHPEFGQIWKTRLQNWSNRIWMLGWIPIIFVALWHAQATKTKNGLPGFTALDFFQPIEPYFRWIGEPIVGFGFVMCIVAILFGSAQLRWLFETRILRWIGMISFSLYMWHLFIIGRFYTRIFHLEFIQGRLMRNLSLWVFVAVIIIPLCFVLYKLVEEPGIRLGQRLTRKEFKPLHFHALKAFLSPRALFARIHRS